MALSRSSRKIGWLYLLILLASAAWAEVEYQKIGASLVSNDAALSCWLVDGDPVGRGVVVKITGVGREGEANVFLSKDDLKELKGLCKKAMSYREPLKDGQIVVLGTFVAYDNRLEVVVLRSNAVTVRCLVAHEKEKEQGFVMESFQEGSVIRLLDESIAALR
jgi:hypothetical protein